MSAKPPDISDECYLFKTYGRCRYGRACRFAKSHLTADFENIVNESLYDPGRPRDVLNVIPRPLQEKLRKRQVEFVKSEIYLKKLNEAKKELSEQSSRSSNVAEMEGGLRTCTVNDDDRDVAVGIMDDGRHRCSTEGSVEGEADCMEEGVVGNSVGGERMQTCGPLTDEETVKLKPEEKKKVPKLVSLVGGGLLLSWCVTSDDFFFPSFCVYRLTFKASCI